MAGYTGQAAIARESLAGYVTARAPVLFGVTILASSCLLFLVQPLESKLILPWFGGSAAVWITCILFFQAGLLLGYLYAHALATFLTPKRQAVTHALLLLGSLASLPILPNAMWQPKPGEDPTWRVFGVLAMSIGLPYLLLSSTSPLLQSWYTGAKRGALPYRYFALSNSGSLAALVAYPVAVEPYLTGHEQAWLWSAGFGVFAALGIGTAWVASRIPSATTARVHHATHEPVPVGQKLMWVGLAACASALLLTVTNLLTQNVAPMPLLWVVPLSIYLLTFILCFESDRWDRRSVFLPLTIPALWCLVTALGPLQDDAIGLTVPLLSASLFVCCMACHGELARMRPEPAQLTSFYLCLAAGGALGGLFVALVAPHVFATTYEFAITFVACPVLLLVVLWRERRPWWHRDVAFGLWLAAAAAAIVLAGYAGRETWRGIKDAVLLKRNFYGALRVSEFRDKGMRVRELTHGTITHGREIMSRNLQNVPTTYYSWESGIGITWRMLASQGPVKMGVIGLGAGTLASYGRAGDTLRFYDINPLVVDIAKKEFAFLANCPAHVETVLGDARLSLARERNQQFDILAVDAFSGDAVPVHLLTREAFQVYWRHLKPEGVLAVHVSNHYLNLAPMVLLNANAFGKQAWEVGNSDNALPEVFDSTWVLVSSRPNFFTDTRLERHCIQIDVPRGLRPWTDDYSNLWQVLSWRANDY